MKSKENNRLQMFRGELRLLSGGIGINIPSGGMAELSQLNGMGIEESYVGPSVIPDEFHTRKLFNYPSALMYIYDQ